jgi:hypothetical protein
MDMIERSILHPLGLFGICKHGNQAGDYWEIIKNLAWFFLARNCGGTAIFITVWAVGTVLMGPHKAATGVDTTIVSNWCKT